MEETSQRLRDRNARIDAQLDQEFLNSYTIHGTMYGPGPMDPPGDRGPGRAGPTGRVPGSSQRQPGGTGRLRRPVETHPQGVIYSGRLQNFPGGKKIKRTGFPQAGSHQTLPGDRMHGNNADAYALGLARTVQQNTKPDVVILFGSRASGNHRENSDVDLLVITEDEDPTAAAASARRAALQEMEKQGRYLPVDAVGMNRKKVRPLRQGQPAPGRTGAAARSQHERRKAEPCRRPRG